MLGETTGQAKAQRHEDVGQVLGLPISRLEWEEASKVIWGQSVEGLECLAQPPQRLLRVMGATGDFRARKGT